MSFLFYVYIKNKKIEINKIKNKQTFIYFFVEKLTHDMRYLK